MSRLERLGPRNHKTKHPDKMGSQPEPSHGHGMWKKDTIQADTTTQSQQPSANRARTTTRNQEHGD
ncbi:hypothetical protein FS842_003972 [Serendipita sp. 407]|nr:hypothetical protein FS842_003972 [Serendipita sp. 407]